MTRTGGSRVRTGTRGACKRAYGKPDEKAQTNFTGPQNLIMKTSNAGFQQCDNAQLAVDAAHQLAVAPDLTANASDQSALPGLLGTVQERFATQPEQVLADAGSGNERGLADLAKRGADGYGAPGREGQQAATRDLSFFKLNCTAHSQILPGFIPYRVAACQALEPKIYRQSVS